MEFDCQADGTWDKTTTVCTGISDVTSGNAVPGDTVCYWGFGGSNLDSISIFCLGCAETDIVRSGAGNGTCDLVEGADYTWVDDAAVKFRYDLLFDAFAPGYDVTLTSLANGVTNENNFTDPGSNTTALNGADAITVDYQIYSDKS